jgi:hypothetical protein
MVRPEKPFADRTLCAASRILSVLLGSDVTSHLPG